MTDNHARKPLSNPSPPFIKSTPGVKGTVFGHRDIVSAVLESAGTQAVKETMSTVCFFLVFIFTKKTPTLPVQMSAEPPHAQYA